MVTAQCSDLGLRNYVDRVDLDLDGEYLNGHLSSCTNR